MKSTIYFRVIQVFIDIGGEFSYFTSSENGISDFNISVCVLKTRSHILCSVILACYLVAGILGPGVIIGTFVSTDNGMLVFQPDDGSSGYNPRILAARRHVIPEKRYSINVHQVSEQRPFIIDRKPVFGNTDLVPVYTTIDRLSNQRPRDPPECA